MEKEEILLGEEMGRLKIEPVKTIKNKCNENPFLSLIQTQNIFKKPNLPLRESKCTCSIQNKVKKYGVYKKKYNKILKEPILMVLKNSGNSNIVLETEESHESNKNISSVNKCDTLNLCTLVHNCNQLSISRSLNEQKAAVLDDNNKWWQKEVANSQELREPKQQSSHSGSCSQQALNPPCDVTIDELASYFETLVHIPKKMSSMAEMMYI